MSLWGAAVLRRVKYGVSRWVNECFVEERILMGHWTPDVLASWQVAIAKRVARCLGQHLYLVSAKMDATRPPKFWDRDFHIARSRHAAARYHAGTSPPVPEARVINEPYWLRVLGLTDDDPVEYMLAAFWSASGAVQVYEPAPRSVEVPGGDEDSEDDTADKGTSQACTSDGVER